MIVVVYGILSVLLVGTNSARDELQSLFIHVKTLLRQLWDKKFERKHKGGSMCSFYKN